MRMSETGSQLRCDKLALSLVHKIGGKCKLEIASFSMSLETVCGLVIF